MKKTRNIAAAITATVMAFSFAAAAAEDFTRYVDPLIGTGGHGHTFVGASVPFGAVQLGPMNIYKGWDWCSGYHYSDKLIIGFSHNHLSGTGCSDLGDISFMPYTGSLRVKRGEDNNIDGAASSTFSHSNEKAEAGYYSVKLDNGVNVELTATERTGMHRYTYDGSGERRVMIDLENGIGNSSYETYVRLADSHTVEGFRFVHGWAPRHKVFFYAVFNEPIKRLDTFLGDTPAGTGELEGVNVKAVATFGSDVKQVIAKVGVSSVSITNAKMNLEKENSGWDFNAVRQAAKDKWNAQLGNVVAQGGSESQLKAFYTALFHMYIAPCLYCDVNGEYRGIDDRIRKADGFDNYTVFSLWDTYRTLHPLFTILQTDKVSDFVNSMLSIYEQNGKLPIWPLYSGETNCMPGYSSVPVIADACLKGFTGFDSEKALKYMVSTATNPNQNGVKEFMQYGYIPADKKGEATSINLEYAADDRGIALLAKRLGHDDIYSTFLKRSNSYQLLFDKKILKIHPKMADGSWYEPYSPFLANHRNGVGDFTEGNGWQYTFMVPQDPEGLISLHGGDKAFIQNLDSLFVAEGDLGEGAPPDVSGLIGQYAHGNEPNHHIAYLYAYAGAQWKTAEKVSTIARKFYSAQPDGYAGNEDCGQMSAWYVSSALGFFQVNPSNGVFVFGSPMFKTVMLKLNGGKRFVVNAKGVSDKNMYISKVKLNGKPYKKAYITYSDIMRGGTLDFVMSSKPNKKFGYAQNSRPTSAR